MQDVMEAAYCPLHGGRDSCFPEFILKRYDKLFMHRRRTYPAKNKFEVIIIN